jgi:16S rRNA (uracil1498-N3)-methyltransferase
MAERYHVSGPLAPGPIDLAGPEAHHLATVCRLRPGDRVCLFNGDGREYPAEVTAAGKRSVSLHVVGVEETARELGFRLEVAVPLPKGDRAQFLVEKLTELGVTSLVPLRTARSVVHPGETKRDKLQRYVIEASKQCGRNVLMAVAPLADWEAYCVRGDLPARRLLAHPGETAGDWSVRADCAMAVGPEGGFTDAEVALARGAGWRTVGLGPRVLRVETAALVLATLAGVSR